MTVIVYARVSTEEQAESELGLDAQMAACELLTGAAPVLAVRETVSGASRPEQRPLLGDALDMLDDPDDDCDTLAVARLDRLGRSAIDILLLAQRAQDNGWTLRIGDLGLDTSTPVGEFTMTILAAMAQLERRMIAERTREALAAKRRRGERIGRPVQLPDSVREKIRELDAANLSLRQIATTLTNAGVPTVGGGPWQSSTIKSVLDSLAYDDALTSASSAS